MGAAGAASRGNWRWLETGDHAGPACSGVGLLCLKSTRPGPLDSAQIEGIRDKMTDVGAMTPEDLSRDAARILRRMRRQAAESLNRMIWRVDGQTAPSARAHQAYCRIVRVTSRQIELIDALTTRKGRQA